ncbi:hypothetical protein [Pleionea sediminis]|uniref:hypothetical protein n=1 Tax=Pleionea sediminis TaxID=2569479 RepID=UPI0011848920|nr:hypothetical protein [Pleionea sediminis]
MYVLIFTLPFALQMLSREDVSLVVRVIIFLSVILGAQWFVEKLRMLAFGSRDVDILSQFIGSRVKTVFLLQLTSLIILIPLHILFAWSYLLVIFEKDFPTNINAFVLFLCSFYLFILGRLISNKVSNYLLLLTLTIYIGSFKYSDDLSIIILPMVGCAYVLKELFAKYLFNQFQHPVFLVAYLQRKVFFFFQVITLGFIYFVSSNSINTVFSASLFVILLNGLMFSMVAIERSKESSLIYLDSIVASHRTLLSNMALIAYVTCLLPASFVLTFTLLKLSIWSILFLTAISFICFKPNWFVNFRVGHSLLLSNFIVVVPLVATILE